MVGAYPQYLDKYNKHIITLAKYLGLEYRLSHYSESHFIYFNIRVFKNSEFIKCNKEKQNLLFELDCLFNNTNYDIGNINAFDDQLKCDKIIYKNTYKKFMKQFGKIVMALSI